MTESGKTEADQLNMKEALTFGERLFAARESQGFTIAEVAKHIRLSKDVIDALERSDLDRLPEPIFVQGYLRTYAKYLGIAEASILEAYSKAAPHALESELHPRSSLPDEASSDSPYVKTVSIVLVILMISAVSYGVYNYYSEMVDSKKTDSANDIEVGLPLFLSAHDSQIETLNIELDIRSKNVAEPLDDHLGLTGELLPRGSSEDEILIETQTDSAYQAETVAINAINNTNREAQPETQPVAAGDDVVELMAHEDSWTEVVDANDVGLLYDLVEQANTVVLKGTAPFDIFLGNAPAMEISINGIKIDMTKFVRSNKIAHFSVSTNNRQVVFH